MSRSSLQPSTVIRFAVCDRIVDVTVPDDQTTVPLRQLYRPYEHPGVASPRAVPNTTITIRTTGDGFAIQRVDGSRHICPTLVRLATELEFALTETFLEACRELPQLHGAGAVLGSHGLLALGSQGAGKSSIALNWSLAGLPLLGDDVLLVGERGRVLPFKRLCKVDPSMLEGRGVPLEHTPFWDGVSAEAWFDPATAGGWGVKGTAAVIARVQFSAREPLTVRPLDRQAVLSLLLGSVLPTGCARRDSLDRLIAVAEAARGYDMTFGDAHEAALALIELAA